MKTRFDPRHKKRQEIVKILFAESFQHQKKNELPRSKLTRYPTDSSSASSSSEKSSRGILSQNKIYVKEILDNLPAIDKLISGIAPEFPVDKINKIDVAILRLSVFELTRGKKEPTKVVIDEAIELAKEFGGDTSPGFINGALGNLVKNFDLKVKS